MKNILIKLGLYTLVYLIVTLIMSDDLSCITSLETYCVVDVLGKYVFFVLAMFVYDRLIKPLLFKTKNQK